MRRLLLLALLLFAFLFLTPAAQAASPFASTQSTQSFWNQPISSNAAVDPSTPTYVNSLLSQIRSAGAWINTYSYSVPVYTVPANQPAVKVTLDGGNGNPEQAQLQGTWLSVPVPASANPAPGSDGDMVVYQPSTDTEWEFWQMHQVAGAWHAQWGGTLTNASAGSGAFPYGSRYFGTRGSGEPLLGGLIRASDLFDGQITHALALSIPHAQAQYFQDSAWRTDGNQSGSGIPMEGMLLRLPASMNVDALGLPPLGRMIAEAAQKYGIRIVDQGGSVAFYGEDTVSEGRPEIWYGPSGFLGGVDPAHALAGFPWSSLQVMQQNTHCCWQY